MNYEAVYNRLIEKRRNNPITKKDCYCEEHHIIPRSLGGANSKENLINLTAKEHYVAHHILSVWYREKFGEESNEYKCMVYAWWYVCGKHKRKFISARTYESLKREIAKKNSDLHSGKNHWNFGGHWSDSVRKKIGDANRGRVMPPDELARRRASNAARKGNLGHKWTEEQKRRASEKLKGRVISEEQKRKQREYWATHKNPMTGVNVKDRMSPEAYEAMLKKRSITMKKRFEMYGAPNTLKGKSKEELEEIKKRRIFAQKDRWNHMTPEEYEEEKLKKKYACAISHLRYQQMKLLMLYIISLI